MSKPIRPVNPDGTWCYRFGRGPRYKPTCTTSAVPPASVELAAKRFEAFPEQLTVYLVRKRWADGVNIVQIDVDGAAAVQLLPESFVRVRVSPGRHQLRAAWPGGTTEASIDGAAGDVKVVELAGSVWAWSTSYRFASDEGEKSRQRVIATRLIGDLDLVAK